MKFKENIPLYQFSNYKIGGLARFFFAPKNEREIAWAAQEAAARKLRIFILGGGTNLLLRDESFEGLVVKPALASITAKRSPKNTIEIGSGVSMQSLLGYSTKNALSGLEWAGGLPGLLGGAIRGNAGCFGGEIKDNVISVRSFDLKKMKVVERNAKACAFGYRDSIFKHAAANEIVLSATLKMAKGERLAIKKAIQEKIEHRKKNHPLEYPNIGSIFKNIPLAVRLGQIGKPEARISLTRRQYKEALAKQALEFRGSPFSVKTDPFPVVSAAKLIAESGLRGVSFGGAMISAKHPNFIVNALDATAFDVKALLELAKASVQKKFGVALEEEIQIV